jgi:cellulose synthase/poly-beta-1,6-N-acetylglucosamine synthase-like glycosyltransferase
MWPSVIPELIVAFYAIGVVLITVYTFGQFHLLYYFSTPKKRERFHPSFIPQNQDDLPSVTVQLPMYNERYVAAAVIDACAKLNYPKDRLEIQVVDDSTDDTVEIVEERVAYWTSQGIDIKAVHREHRHGFKAGALADATPSAKGEFIAIFDADFRPNPSFLERTIPYFQNKKVGIVQGRWGHINRDYSVLTKSQSIFLDMFFIIEQQARSLAGFFLRFNGSGGVWRKNTIEDAGGWSADTLSEDLDLAFRAQLKDWEVIYDVDVEAPAEIPVTMLDFKAQQYRWTKGKAQVVRKLWGSIRKKGMTFNDKMHVYFDLFNFAIIPGIFLIAMLSLPLVILLDQTDGYETVLQYFSIALINIILAPIYAFLVMRHYHQDSKKGALKETIITFFPFTLMTLGMMAFQITSMIEGFISKKVFFHRTSKYNITSNDDKWKDKVYRPSEVPIITYVEGLLALYFMAAIYVDFAFGGLYFLPFHLLLVSGFLYVFILSFRKA